MLTRWTKPVAFGYKHKSRFEARAVPTLITRVAQKNPFRMISLATFLTGIFILGFLDFILG
jgi:hypothetical protein